MTIKQKSTRNARIYKQFKSGKSKTTLAEQEKLSWVQINTIIKNEALAERLQELREQEETYANR